MSQKFFFPPYFFQVQVPVEAFGETEHLDWLYVGWISLFLFLFFFSCKLRLHSKWLL